MLRGGKLARLLSMGRARALTKQSSPKHVQSAQSDLELEHEQVRVDVADGVTAATNRQRWKAPSEGLGVCAPAPAPLIGNSSAEGARGSKESLGAR